MNNKPVAFWNKDFDLWEENAIQTYKADGWNIPLYTHPVNVTYELTMEKCRQQQADLKDADKYALELERLYEDAKAEIEALTKESLTMLRQQQAEIAELKVMLGHYEDVYEGVVTHPAELTDDEIIKVYQSLWQFLPAEEPRLAKDIKEFARAILKKASEK